MSETKKTAFPFFKLDSGQHTIRFLDAQPTVQESFLTKEELDRYIEQIKHNVHDVESCPICKREKGKS